MYLIDLDYFVEERGSKFAQIWDLFQNKHLFDALDSNGNYRNEYHFAEMIAYMGPPPLEFLSRSTESWEYFDKQGLNNATNIGRMMLT